MQDFMQICTYASEKGLSDNPEPSYVAGNFCKKSVFLPGVLKAQNIWAPLCNQPIHSIHMRLYSVYIPTKNPHDN